jgi:hypothetical protein
VRRPTEHKLSYVWIGDERCCRRGRLTTCSRVETALSHLRVRAGVRASASRGVACPLGMDCERPLRPIGTRPAPASVQRQQQRADRSYPSRASATTVPVCDPATQTLRPSGADGKIRHRAHVGEPHPGHGLRGQAAGATGELAQRANRRGAAPAWPPQRTAPARTGQRRPRVRRRTHSHTRPRWRGAACSGAPVRRSRSESPRPGPCTRSPPTWVIARARSCPAGVRGRPLP